MELVKCSRSLDVETQHGATEPDLKLDAVRPFQPREFGVRKGKEPRHMHREQFAVRIPSLAQEPIPIAEDAQDDMTVTDTRNIVYTNISIQLIRRHFYDWAA